MRDKQNVRAELEHLEAERERRIDAKVAEGAAVREELVVVLRGVDNEVEDAKAARLSELRGKGEKREFIFDVTCIVTGVVRSTEINKPQPSTVDDYRPDYSYSTHRRTYGPTK